MKDFICRCNNCDSILIDKNPKDDSEEQELNGKELEMISIYDTEEECNFWAFPNCMTDGYLTDFI